MDLYGATKIGDKQIKDLRFVGDGVGQHETTRTNMGYSRRYADRMDLAAMTPRGDLSRTGFCLAAPGRVYLIYQPGEGPFQVQPWPEARFAHAGPHHAARSRRPGRLPQRGPAQPGRPRCDIQAMAQGGAVGVLLAMIE